MNHTQIVLTTEEKETIKKMLSNKKTPWQMVKRIETLRLTDKGYTTKAIAAMLCIKINRVQEYLRIYRASGLEGLLTMEKPGRESLLTEEMFRRLEVYIWECEKTKKKCTHHDKKMFILNTFGIDIQESWLAKRLRDRKLALKEEPWK